MLTADAGMACWVATSSHAATRCSHAASETIFPIRRPEYHSIQVERHTVKQNDRSVESVTTQQTVHNIYEYRSLLLLTSKCYYYYNLTQHWRQIHNQKCTKIRMAAGSVIANSHLTGSLKANFKTYDVQKATNLTYVEHFLYALHLKHVSIH